MNRTGLYLILLLLLCGSFYRADEIKPPVARFSFNNGSNEDEISHRRSKMVNTGFTEDRFGNQNSSALIYGNQDSYINLGNYPALKPKEGSISLWINIEHIIYSGRGIRVNPIITTRNCSCNDFNEAYTLTVDYDAETIGGALSNDSLKQVSLMSHTKLRRHHWYHMVLTYNYNTASFYLDGKLQATFGKNFESYFEPTDSVMVGLIFNEKNRRVFRGAVDDIEFFDRVLTPPEVQALYNAPDPNTGRNILHRIFFVLALLAVSVSIYFFSRYRFAIRLKKEKRQLELITRQLENELRINRALMNPHFVFNAMNTLHNYILTNSNEKASDYLVKFSKLLRRILDSNMSDNISMELELELVELYLELESMRFKEPFRYDIIKDPAIVLSSSIIPIMMIQPFIENSIWHGLLDKKGEKEIRISFTLHEQLYLHCVIEDNGTGRKTRPPDPFAKKSLATNFVMQRLALLNRIHDLNCSLRIIDKENGQGTIVHLILPILNKLQNHVASHTH